MKAIRKAVSSALITLLAFAPGCMTQQKAEKILSEPPVTQYVQDNIGPVDVGFDLPRLFTFGYVKGFKRDPKCTIYLSPFATKHFVYHEASHSFEAMQMKEKERMWGEFYLALYNRDMKGGIKYHGLPLQIALKLPYFFMPIPIPKELGNLPPVLPIPNPIDLIGELPGGPGHPNLLSCVNHSEHVAELMLDVMEGEHKNLFGIPIKDPEYERRRECAERFMNGAYGKKSKETGMFLDDLMGGKELEKEIAAWRSSYIMGFIIGEYGEQSKRTPRNVFIALIDGRELQKSKTLDGLNYIRSLVRGAYAENPEDERKPDAGTIAFAFNNLVSFRYAGNYAQKESSTYIRRLFSGIYEDSSKSQKNSQTVGKALEGIIQ